MSATPTPWQRSGIRAKAMVGGTKTDGHQIGPDGDPVALVYYSDRTPALHQETLANADFIVEAVNNYASLKARIERLKAALRESLTDNAWNAYHCGVTKAGGKWMDGGMSDAEWLQSEMGLQSGWHDCAEIQRRIPEVVEKQLAALEAKHD